MDINNVQTGLLLAVAGSNLVLAITSWKHKRETSEKDLTAEVERFRKYVDERFRLVIEDRLVDICKDCEDLYRRWNVHSDYIHTLLTHKEVSQSEVNTIKRDMEAIQRQLERLQRMRGHMRSTDIDDSN